MNKKFLSAILFGALMITSTGTFVSCKDYDDDINDLQEQIDKKASLDEMTSKLAAMESDLAACKSNCAANLAAAKAELEKAIDAAAKAAAEAKVTAAEAKAEAIAAAEAKVKEMKETLDAALAKNAEDFKALQDEFAALEEELLNVIGKRLTSLVFAPSYYVDGIEAVKFSTLQYTAWDADSLFADEATGDEMTISDGKASVNYYVSPSTIDMKSIESWNVLLNQAENVLLNQAENARAAVGLTATPVGEPVNGKLQLVLSKNGTESFAEKDGKFTIMALQALLAADEENEVAAVTSDWARIFQTDATPYIHATDTLADAPHFYVWSEAKEAATGELVVKEAEYDKSINLNELVTVCLTGEEACEDTLTAAEIAAYDMAFEFALVEYKLQNKDEEATDQAKFAVIDDKGIMTSCAYDGTKNNADAVGREPMVQVVLKDAKNDEIIDVKYFKIKWTTKFTFEDLGALTTFTAEYDCDSVYSDTIKTAAMNAIYTKLNISKSDFHALYKPDNYPDGFKTYASIKDMEDGKVATDLGSLIQITPKDATTTYNIKWDYTAADAKITEAEYKAGKATRTVYCKYVNEEGTSTIVFSVTREFTIKNMTLVGGYVQTYWSGELKTTNADKMFQVNPALMSDVAYGSTNYDNCRIITNLLHGYNVTGTAAADLTIKDIVSENVEGAQFVFDSIRVAAIDTTWTVVNTETASKLKIAGEEAAEITVVNNRAYIKLFETDNYTKATEAAKKLVGKKVPVKLVAKHCTGYEEVLDQYMVHFIEPLEAKLNMTEGELQDLLNKGSELDIRLAMSVSEKFGEKNPVVYVSADSTLASNADLVKWYDVKPATWDVEAATTNLKVDGNNLVITNGDFTTPFATHKDKYQLSVKYNDGGYPVALVFHNNSGTHLQQAFQVRVPVYVSTKWNSKLEGAQAYVTVTIKPGVTE